jgi:hypothetical protein
VQLIDNYRFGHITINNKKYTTDVIILPGFVKSNWWRSQGHKLSMDDIIDIIKQPPEILIIGTGSEGVMQVPDSVNKQITELGIQLIVEKTGEACKLYNELSRSKKVVAALHLTC